jgi:hypothetical protein
MEYEAVVIQINQSISLFVVFNDAISSSLLNKKLERIWKEAAMS